MKPANSGKVFIEKLAKIKKPESRDFVHAIQIFHFS